VIVIDDHAMFRQAIGRVLSRDVRIRLVAIADNPFTGIADTKAKHPSVVVTDLRMPGMRGSEVARELNKLTPLVEVLVLTVSEEQDDLFEALRAGARGYVLKSAVQEEIGAAIVATSNRESWLSPRMATKLIDEFTRLPSSAVREALSAEVCLTPREQAVLGYLAQGLTNREIANVMTIAETTVKTHLKHVLEKLQCRNRLEAASYALKAGFELGTDPC
jgi:two-component system NarL family response regulator